MRRLALFARQPVTGQVKTRLAPALPPDLACQLHHAMVVDALAVLASTPADERTLYWDEARPGQTLELPAGVQARVQRGDSLGERLAAAFQDMLIEADQAVIFGSDCPALGAAELRALFAALDHHDLALHPAVDGGFVAIGLRRSELALFRDVDWGGPEVASRMLDNARALGLAVDVAAPPLEDLDTPDDLARHVARQVDPAGVRSPALDHTLRSFGLLPSG